jgi:hypothetical protein
MKKAKAVSALPSYTGLYKWIDIRTAFHLNESFKTFSQLSLRQVLMKTNFVFLSAATTRRVLPGPHL